MRKFICLLLALCLMVPFAMAEEDEDELSLSDCMEHARGAGAKRRRCFRGG